MRNQSEKRHYLASVHVAAKNPDEAPNPHLVEQEGTDKQAAEASGKLHTCQTCEQGCSRIPKSLEFWRNGPGSSLRGIYAVWS
eukprot:4320179-Amphidinium_carterae.1